MENKAIKNEMWKWAIMTLVILLATPTIEGLLLRYLPFMIGPILSWIIKFVGLFLVIIPTDLILRRIFK